MKESEQKQAEKGAKRAQTLKEWATEDVKDTKGLDWSNPLATAKRYFRQEEGKELRSLHRSYARQYQKLYGYSVATFVFAGLFAYGLGSLRTNKGKQD